MLKADGTINILGCNVAAGDEGKRFIDLLESTYDMDFAGSVDPTSVTEGGDMVLETDDIDAA
eukprot:COSAG06_NODE_3889_length_4802_cov_1.710610_6_plen_62_part_00